LHFFAQKNLYIENHTNNIKISNKEKKLKLFF
jgi:hypothetical protein